MKMDPCHLGHSQIREDIVRCIASHSSESDAFEYANLYGMLRLHVVQSLYVQWIFSSERMCIEESRGKTDYATKDYK